MFCLFHFGRKVRCHTSVSHKKKAPEGYEFEDGGESSVRFRKVRVSAIINQPTENASLIKTVYRSGEALSTEGFESQSTISLSFDTRKPEKKVAMAELTIAKRLSLSLRGETTIPKNHPAVAPMMAKRLRIEYSYSLRPARDGDEQTTATCVSVRKNTKIPPQIIVAGYLALEPLTAPPSGCCSIGENARRTD